MLAKRLGLIAVLSTVALSNANADANSLNDYLGPRVISVGEVGRADARESSSTTLNPAGLALGQQVVFEGSYGFRPGDGASNINVSACDSTVPIAGCFYYRFFEASPELGEDAFDRSAHEFGATLARSLTESVMVGVNFRYFDYDSELLMEGGDTRGFTFDAGAVIRPSDLVSLGVVGYNLVPQDTPQYPTAVGAGLSLRPIPVLSVGFDGLWDLDDDAEQGTGRYGVGAEYFVTGAAQQSGYPIRVGGVYDAQLDSSYVTGGLGFLSNKVGIDVGVRKQVDGGDELMVQAGLRFFGPSVR